MPTDINGVNIDIILVLNTYCLRNKNVDYFVRYVSHFNYTIKLSTHHVPKLKGSVKTFGKTKYLSFIVKKNGG